MTVFRASRTVFVRIYHLFVLDLPPLSPAFLFLLSQRTPNDAASSSTLPPLSRPKIQYILYLHSGRRSPFLTTPRGSVAGKKFHSSFPLLPRSVLVPPDFGLNV